jgi:transmembrane sensor
MSAQASASLPVSAAVLDAAIGWQLRMGSGEAGARDAEGLRRWLDAHADHRRAWAQLGELDAQLAPARSEAVRSALVRRGAARRWKQSAGVLGLLAALLLGLGAVDRFEPLATLSADYRTGTGERLTVVLPDRSVLHLDTRSAVDLAFDGNRRAIVLRAGEIAIETAHGDAAEQRPFVVLTPEGSLRALGTRFVVRRLGDGAGTRLTVTQSAVAARPATCAADPAQACEGERIVQQGQSLELRADGAGTPGPARPDTDAWKDGMLVVDDQPLAEVVAELARYRPGHLAVDPRVAGLRVTGTLPLDDTDKALLALTAAVPVELVGGTRWWQRIEPRQAPR